MSVDEQDDAKPEKEKPTSTTAWHPMLVTVFDRFLPAGWKLNAEFLLNRLPQRVDIVVIRAESMPTSEVRRLHSIFDYLRKHTLIEYKGPTDDLEASDLLTLLGYGCQYMAMNKIFDPEDVQLMVIADRIPRSFVEQVERMKGTFVHVGNGLWQGHMAGLSLHGVALREACEAGPSEHLLYLFSKAFLKDPNGGPMLDKEDVEMYRLLRQQVAQFRKDPSTMALRDIDRADESINEAWKRILQDLTLEERLEGLPPEQVLACYTPEQRFVGLTPEQRLAGLTLDQILSGLPPELARKLRS